MDLNGYTPENVAILKDWANQAQGWVYLHNQTAEEFLRWHKTMLSIIILAGASASIIALIAPSTEVNASNAASGSTLRSPQKRNPDHIDLLREILNTTSTTSECNPLGISSTSIIILGYLSAAMMIGVASFTTLVEKLDWKGIAVKHNEAKINYFEIAKDIRDELALPYNERIPYYEFESNIEDRFGKLQTESPGVPGKFIRTYILKKQESLESNTLGPGGTVSLSLTKEDILKIRSKKKPWYHHFVKAKKDTRSIDSPRLETGMLPLDLGYFNSGDYNEVLLPEHSAVEKELSNLTRKIEIRKRWIKIINKVIEENKKKKKAGDSFVNVTRSISPRPVLALEKGRSNSVSSSSTHVSNGSKTTEPLERSTESGKSLEKSVDQSVSSSRSNKKPVITPISEEVPRAKKFDIAMCYTKIQEHKSDPDFMNQFKKGQLRAQLENEIAGMSPKKGNIFTKFL